MTNGQFYHVAHKMTNSQFSPAVRVALLRSADGTRCNT
nr:MAG TPA: hypothetical protein [Caudoviricetes sp.]